MVPCKKNKLCMAVFSSQAAANHHEKNTDTCDKFIRPEEENLPFAELEPTRYVYEMVEDLKKNYNPSDPKWEIPPQFCVVAGKSQIHYMRGGSPM